VKSGETPAYDEPGSDWELWEEEELHPDKDEPLGAVFPWKEAEITDPKELLELCDAVNEFIHSPESGWAEYGEETALAAVKLRLLNYLSRNPEAADDDQSEEIEKMRHLSTMEAEFSAESNPLPTVGLELEAPHRYLTPYRRDILDALGIPNERETPGLWEVITEFSYSPWVQGRIIQELAVMGAIPLVETKTGMWVPDAELLSLHVNLSPPGGLEYLQLVRYKKEALLLNDMMIYAFDSPQRILGRKTSESHLFRAGYKSKRSKKTKLPDTDPWGSTLHPTRAEARAGEFRDFPTYRMIVEYQRMAGMYFSHVKLREGMELTKAEAELAKLWADFESDADGVLGRYTGGKLNLVDSDRERAAKIVKETDIRPTCRHLITDYSKKVAAVIKETTAS
jgi:hypothetical protein